MNKNQKQILEEKWNSLSKNDKLLLLSLCNDLLPKKKNNINEAEWYNTLGDILGIFDPTGVIDLANGISYINQGDYLFNTFIRITNDVYSSSFPIPEITKLNISFLFPDGSVPDFRNINHSFTLKIIEEVIQSNDMQKNSNHTNYINEMKRLH